MRNFPPYSDYNFTSLYCYNVNDKVEFSWLNENLVVLFQDYISDEMFYSFLGDNLVTETALTLFNHIENVEEKKEFRLIPYCTRIILDGLNQYDISEDLASHDYIVSVNSLCNYQGDKFRKKRYGVIKFLKKYPNSRTQILDINSNEAKLQLTDLFFIWKEGRSVTMENTQHELKAFKRLLANSQHFNLIVLGVFVENNLIEFTISERLNDDFAVVHFEKHNSLIEGISSFGLQELAKHLSQTNCVHLNLEQDLGLDGLRTMKRQFRPTSFLKKYKIYKRN